jgi:hypothetical protein
MIRGGISALVTLLMMVAAGLLMAIVAITAIPDPSAWPIALILGAVTAVALFAFLA